MWWVCVCVCVRRLVCLLVCVCVSGLLDSGGIIAISPRALRCDGLFQLERSVCLHYSVNIFATICTAALLRVVNDAHRFFFFFLNKILHNFQHERQLLVSSKHFSLLAMFFPVSLPRFSVRTYTKVKKQNHIRTNWCCFVVGVIFIHNSFSRSDTTRTVVARHHTLVLVSVP